MAAIDQLIAQGGGQQFDPLATVGRVTQLQNLRLQGQAGQQEVQARALQNQQAQQDFSDQQHLRSLYNGLQPGQIPSDDDILKAAGPKLGMAIVTQHRQMLKAQADLQDTQGKVAAGEQEYVANMARAIQQSGYDPNVTHTILSTAAQIPGYGQHVQALAQMYDQNPGQFKQTIDSVVAQSPKQATATKDLAQADLANAQIPGAQAKAQQEQRANFASQLAATGSQQAYDAARGQLPFAVASQFPAKYDHDAVLQAGMTPHEQATVPVEMQAAKAWLAKNPGKTMADFNEYNKKLVPTTTFNLQNGGLTGQNGQPSAVAQSIANGQMKWSDAVSARTAMPVKEALLREVKSINPNFNSGDFTVEQKVREKYTSGNVSDQLLAIGTAREHMKLFAKLASDLDNGNVQAANKIGNAFGVQFGSDKATNFRIASQAFGGEVGKAFDGAGVTEGERKSASSSYNENMGNQQFQGAVKTVDALLAGKQKAAKDAYSAGTQGKPNFGTTGTEGAITVTDPRGVVHTFKDQASADNFKKLAGIK